MKTKVTPNKALSCQEGPIAYVEVGNVHRAVHSLVLF